MPGKPVLVTGTAFSEAGERISGATVNVWQADDEGYYDVQKANLDLLSGRARFRTDQNGSFWFWSIKPPPAPPVADHVRKQCSYKWSTCMPRP